MEPVRHAKPKLKAFGNEKTIKANSNWQGRLGKRNNKEELETLIA
jgi:hypothetical protein